MAAQYPASATRSHRTLTVRGRVFPASVVTCGCPGCGGRKVLAPTQTVESCTTKRALHSLVAQAKVLGFPPADDTTTVVLASTVTAGQKVTEVGTPDGPFYEVKRVNPKSLVVYLDADHHEDGTIRLPIRATDQVRIAAA